MLNKFEHLTNGLTVIHCENVNEGGGEQGYIDISTINYGNSFKLEWHIWKVLVKKTKKSVGGSDPETGKILHLRRVIGEYISGPEFNFTLLNGDYFDVRNCNIFSFKPGTGHSGRIRKAKDEKI